MRRRVAAFGPFRLYAAERVLEKSGIPVKIGSRALDILITLVEQAPEIVSKRDLLRRAWGELVVDDVSLRVHVTSLRKRLGDGDSSVSYVTNIPGRGYCFTGAVTWMEGSHAPFTATERDVIAYAPVLYAQLRRHFSEAEILELGTVMAVLCGTAKRELSDR